MVYQLVLPAMEGIEELRVLQWHKKEGDLVEAEQLLVELETDKAVVEIRSPRTCALRKVFVSDGSWALIGPPLAWLSDAADEPVVADTHPDFMPMWEVL